MKNKEKGFTLVEILIVVAIIALLSIGGIRFFSDTFSVWWHTRDVSRATGDARVAIDEITTYLRQATSIDTRTGSSVHFNIYREEWADDRMGYFQEGDTLRRFMRGSTTTLVSSDVESFSLQPITSEGRYYHIEVELKVSQGEGEKINLSRRVMLRGLRGVEE